MANDSAEGPADENDPSECDSASNDHYIETNKDACTWAMIAHLSAIIASPLTGLLGGFVGPLVIWLVKKNEFAFVDDQAKEALNFQLTLLLAYAIAYVITTVSCFLLFFVLLIPFVLQIIFGIIGAIKANEGQFYRYPLNIRMIK